jgi:hypothetical protein
MHKHTTNRPETPERLEREREKGAPPLFTQRVDMIQDMSLSYDDKAHTIMWL